jgi:hypothetical protein
MSSTTTMPIKNVAPTTTMKEEDEEEQCMDNQQVKKFLIGLVILLLFILLIYYIYKSTNGSKGSLLSSEGYELGETPFPVTEAAQAAAFRNIAGRRYSPPKYSRDF